MRLLFFAVLLSPATAFFNRKSTEADTQAIIEEILDESLKSHRVSACDGERVTLHCPRNTHIAVETGFYGRVVPPSQLCPSRDGNDALSSTHHSTCDVIQAKSRLSELCDKKRKCSVYVDSTTFEEDPCPSTSKYMQMSYKCKPISFDGESFCEGSEMQLECREGRRLAVYSASYGRSARGQAAHCPAPPTNFHKDCELDALPQVLSRCHAQSGCSLSVSDRLFGRPCPTGVPPYLNIIFMCVNEEIFSEEAIKGELMSISALLEREGSGSLPDNQPEIEDFIPEKKVEDKSEHKEDVRSSEELSTIEKVDYHDVVHEAIVEETRIRKEEEKQPLYNDAEYLAADAHFVRHEAPSELPPRDEPRQQGANAVGIAHDIVVIYNYMRGNPDKLFLCVALSLCFALSVLLVACLAHQCCCRRREEGKMRYSIERSQLLAKGSQMMDGPPSLMDMGDLPLGSRIGNETFLRYSISTPPRSLHSHYDI